MHCLVSTLLVNHVSCLALALLSIDPAPLVPPFPCHCPFSAILTYTLHCTRATPKNLTVLSHFPAPPSSQLVAGGNAEAAGMRVGDRVVATMATMGTKMWSQRTLDGAQAAISSRLAVSDDVTFDVERLLDGNGACSGHFMIDNMGKGRRGKRAGGSVIHSLMGMWKTCLEWQACEPYRKEWLSMSVLCVVCAGEDSISSRAVDVYEVELEKPLAIGTLPFHWSATKITSPK